MTKISIIMPVWNEEKHINKALSSILKQTFKDFEIIIVDDCSTDKTPEIIKKFKNHDSRIKFLKTPINSGTGHALNLGFSIATGQYQTWFAGDNWMNQDCLEELNNALDKNPNVIMAYGDCLVLKKNEFKYLKSCDFEKKTVRQNVSMGSFWLFRKEAKEKAGDYISDICEDYYMHVVMSEIGDFIRIPKSLGVYRFHEKNLTNRIAIHRIAGPIKTVRSLARYKVAKYKIIYISNTFSKSALDYIDMFNRLTDEFGVRYISDLKESDLTLGVNDDEIQKILKDCDLVHAEQSKIKNLKFYCPVVYGKWEADENLIKKYKSNYFKMIFQNKIAMI